MKLLNGDIILLRSDYKGDTLFNQVSACINILCKELTALKLPPESVYKLVIFHDMPGKGIPAEYLNSLYDLVAEMLHPQVLIIPLHQPPLGCEVLAEAHYYDPEQWQLNHYTLRSGGASVFRNGSLTITTGYSISSGGTCKMDAENAFETLGELFSLTGFSFRDIVRQWNYIEDIVGYQGEHQNYQVFNDIRSKYYKDHFKETGYPAATGIGMISGGLVLEYIAFKNDDIRSVPLDNPEQVPAYLYDQDCLEGLPINEDKTTPKFERGRQLSIGNNEYVFISGTAAISGKKSVYPGNIERQTDLTLANIERLVSSQNLLKRKISQGDLLFDYLRIYVKEISHYKPVESACRKKFGEVPSVFLVADICRKDLLVEVEGTMVLISK